MMDILLVEDEAVPALDLKMRLKEFGHTVVAHATDGKTAVERALSLKPDLILMDIKLKGDVDGIEAAREILRSKPVPIVFLSAFSDRETLKRSMSIAPHGYVLKPVNDRDLFATLESAFTRSKLENDLKQRLEVESMFSRITSCAAKTVSLDDFLNKSLSVVGETLSVSRVYYLQYDRVSNSFMNIKEWCAPGISSAIEIVDGTPVRDDDFVIDQIRKNETFICTDIREIDLAELRMFFEKQNIRAFVLFPVVVDDQLFGIVGFDDCVMTREWKPEELKTLETMVDLLKGLILRLESELRLREMIEFEKVIIKISNIILNSDPGKEDAAIHEVLHLAGEAMDADRVYVFRFEHDGRFYHNTHEWCRDGVEPQINRLQGRDIKESRYFYSRLSNNEIFGFEDTNDIPDTAVSEKQSLLAQSIKSILIIPAFNRGILRGFIGFDAVCRHKHWSSMDTQILRIFSEMCLGILERKDMMKNWLQENT